MNYRNFSISHKLFFSFAVVFFLVMSLLFLALHFFTSRGIHNAIIQELETSNRLATEIIYSQAEATIRSQLKSLVVGALGAIEYIDKQGVVYGKSLEERQNDAEDFLAGIKVGETGYPYVLNSQGVFQYHPYYETDGSSLMEYEFVRKQIRSRRGYMAYSWANPGETVNRDKVLYMERYMPWDWIITISAYREEFNRIVSLEDLRDSIEKVKIRDKGYFFVMDLEGHLLIHPTMEGVYYRDVANEENLDLSFYEEMLQTRNGRIEYEWYAPKEEGIFQKMVIYRYLPELDWIVAASIYLDDYSDTRDIINTSLTLFLILAAVLFLIASKRMASLITRPLKELIRSFDTPLEDNHIKDEIRQVANQVHSYMNALNMETNMRKITEEKNRILAEFPEGNPFPVLRVGRNNRILYANPPARTLLDDWGTGLHMLLPEELFQQIKEFSGEFGSLEYQVGEKTYNIMMSFYEDQQAYYLLVVDITDHKRSEALMLMSESVFYNTMEGIVITDPEGTIQRVNNAFQDITGYSAEEAIGENPRILKSDRHEDDFYKEMWETLISKGTWAGEIWNRRKNGDPYPEWLTINSIKDEMGQLMHYVALFRDISDLKRSEEELRHQAYHDSLTGLPNRMLFEDRLSREIIRAERENSIMAVIFLDMDNFKTINDSLGHHVGDSFLVNIADRLKKACREDDTVARLGGDEFVILLPNMQLDRNIVRIVKRLQFSLGESLFFDNNEIVPSASIGITFYPNDGKNAQLLMKNADMAMYKSKQGEKGSYSFYNQKMSKRFYKRIELEGRLKNALKNNEIRIAYQPKVSPQTELIEGFEALIRWESADLGMIPPTDFIDLAEETGYIMELGDWVLEKSLYDLRDFEKVVGRDLEMAVNLSARQFKDTHMVERIEQILGSSPVDRSHVNLEITENMAMENPDRIFDILEQLYNLNVKISIDDFGTGYSSFSYLTLFKTNSLKIDKSFVDGTPENEKKSAVVRNIIELSHILGMEVVAEGVESREQADFLRQAGCELIQGYYYSKPLFKSEMIRFLGDREKSLAES
ncbi:MAG: EAL domain-containing protein [Spirochaetales bacterium]|nr:EAL domain-containing protein [Spirochaetales bacterium]